MNFGLTPLGRRLRQRRLDLDAGVRGGGDGQLAAGQARALARARESARHRARAARVEAPARVLDVQVQQAVLQGDQQFIPGLGNSRAVRSFVARARAGAISDVIDTGTAFVVVRVRDVQPEGYRSLDEVRAEVEPRVRLEKKKEVQVAKLREALQTAGFDGLAAATGGTRSATADLSYANPVVTGLGREPAFVGTAFGLEPSQVSGPVGGANAAYVLRVTNKTEADPAQMTGDQRTQLRTELLNRERQRVVNQWIDNLHDAAEIEDNRSLFF